MKQNCISVIIPVYNAGCYLKECLDSIIGQSFKDLEIILIDDGSTDNSLEICRCFAESDSRVTVLHQENSGVSRARNKGLAVAKGEYVCFCDADDLLMPGFFEILVNAVLKEHGDISCCRYRKFSDERSIPISIDVSVTQKIAIQEEMYTAIDDTAQYGGYLWNKLFRKQIIDKNSIVFDEKISIMEDMIFILQYLKYVSKMVLVDMQLYLYRENASGAMKGKITERRLTEIDARKKICEEYAPCCGNEAFSFSMTVKLVRCYSNLLIPMILSNIRFSRKVYWWRRMISGIRRVGIDLKRIDCSRWSVKEKVSFGLLCCSAVFTIRDNKK